MSAAADMFVKHLIAQQSKAFFGYGPRGRTAAHLQGRVAVFATRLEGPELMAALAVDPFGRLAMRHINRLYVRATADTLRRLASERFGLTLDTVESDIDFEAGLSLGIALADRPLPMASPDPPAPAGLAAAVAAAMGTASEVRLGPALLVARAGVPPGFPPMPSPADGPDAAAVFKDLDAWHTFRTALGERLTSAGRDAGLQPRGCFAAPAGGGMVAGLLLQ